MREIKFRAWDTYNKILRYAKNYGTITVLFEELDYRDDLVLMQYTGLKDKNCKEIYEGDILSEFDSNIKKVVKFGEWEISDFEYSSRGYGYYLEEITTHEISNMYYYENLQIIGDIYKNPELMEKI